MTLAQFLGGTNAPRAFTRPNVTMVPNVPQSLSPISSSTPSIETIRLFLWTVHVRVTHQWPALASRAHESLEAAGTLEYCGSHQHSHDIPEDWRSDMYPRIKKTCGDFLDIINGTTSSRIGQIHPSVAGFVNLPHLKSQLLCCAGWQEYNIPLAFWTVNRAPSHSMDSLIEGSADSECKVFVRSMSAANYSMEVPQTDIGHCAQGSSFRPYSRQIS